MSVQGIRREAQEKEAIYNKYGAYYRIVWVIIWCTIGLVAGLVVAAVQYGKIG